MFSFVCWKSSGESKSIDEKKNIPRREKKERKISPDFKNRSKLSSSYIDVNSPNEVGTILEG